LARSGVPAPAKLTFIGVVAGEWLKLRKQRSFAWATLSALLMSAAVCALGASLLGDEWNKDPVAALGLATSMPSSSIIIASTLFGLGLCIWLAGEFVSGSNYLTLLVVPRRGLVFWARLGLVGVLAVLFSVAVALIGTGAALLVLGPDNMSRVVSQSDFWLSTLATLVVCVSTALLYFAAATLTCRSLPAVGIVAVLLLVLPSLGSYVSLVGGPAILSQMLGCSPGSLMSDVLAVGPGALTTGFSPFVASLLLIVWSVLLVAGAAWRFQRYE
jgi:ABC-2 type transport system permease protein